MKRIVLIDFENVHDSGFSGVEHLTESDVIHIFYTENAKHITLDSLDQSGTCRMILHKVPASKQSLDMHLVSFLGFLLGKNTEKDAEYVIVSKDKDYDNIVSFWAKSGHPEISRHANIAGALGKETPKKPVKPKKTSSRKTRDSAKEPVQKVQDSPTPEELKAQNNMKPEAPKVSEEKIPVPEQISQEESKTEAPVIQAKEEEKKPAEKAQKAEKPASKPAKKSAKKSEKPTGQDLNDVNNAVQKALSDGGFPTEVISYSASTVCRSLSEQNPKQLVYRAFLSKFGQKEGREVYSLVKKLL